MPTARLRHHVGEGQYQWDHRQLVPPDAHPVWPLWFHRVCLVHNRLFGWAYLAGLALGAAVPAFHL